jgi:hypothetical protein
MLFLQISEPANTAADRDDFDPLDFPNDLEAHLGPILR